VSDNEVSSNGYTYQMTEYVVDKNTGEILEVVKDIPYQQPIDISSIVSREIFEGVVNLRRKKWYKLWISPLVLDIVIDRGISIPALSVLCLLGQRIGYNNMVYTTSKDLMVGSGYGRQAVSGAISELKQSGYIREVDNKLQERDSRFFLVNPLYFFLGYFPHRDNLIKDWMRG
jgi:DNA-binding MarR family transcriptional regulator